MAARTGADKPYTTSPFKTSRACAHVFYTPSPPSPKKRTSLSCGDRIIRAPRKSMRLAERERVAAKGKFAPIHRRALRFFIRLLGGDGGSLF